MRLTGPEGEDDDEEQRGHQLAHARDRLRRAAVVKIKEVDVGAEVEFVRAELAHREHAEPAGVARYRSFRDITPSGVIGDARRATANKGERLMTACRDGIAALLRNPQTWR